MKTNKMFKLNAHIRRFLIFKLVYIHVLVYCKNFVRKYYRIISVWII